MSTIKENRNRDLVLYRINDPKTWSFGELGDYFNMHKTVAEEIFKRDLEKYATAEQISHYLEVMSK